MSIRYEKKTDKQKLEELAIGTMWYAIHPKVFWIPCKNRFKTAFFALFLGRVRVTSLQDEIEIKKAV